MQEKSCAAELDGYDFHVTASEIKAFRKARGLTQSELGKLCGVGKSSVSQWESGTTEPSGAARVILEEYVSGQRALVQLTPLEERLLDEAVTRAGLPSREALLEKILLDLIRQQPTPAPTSGKRGKK